jgi:hypothetical protein
MRDSLEIISSTVPASGVPYDHIHHDAEWSDPIEPIQTTSPIHHDAEWSDPIEPIRTIPPIHHDAEWSDPIEPIRTIPPMCDGGKSNDKVAREVVVDTCKNLLHKLEEIRVSVLHLQYSLHAGDLGGVSVEASTRAQQLWAWDQGGEFSTEVATGVLEGALNNVFDGGFPDPTGQEDDGNEGSQEDSVIDDPEKNITDIQENQPYHSVNGVGSIPILGLRDIGSSTIAVGPVDSFSETDSAQGCV